MRAAWLWACIFLLPVSPLGADDRDRSGKQERPDPADLDPAPAGFDVRRDGIDRGKVEEVEYDSKSVLARRTMGVYTPPGYAEENKYPVLYLLHGAGGFQTGWTKKGSADAILDNLYADKKLVPMIVVMPDGFARRPGDPGPTGAFEADLLKDIIPYVESHYSVRADRADRALAGLSMGATQALEIGLKHLDQFAWVGAFSGANFDGPQADLVPDPDAARTRLRLLWLSCGDKDNRAASVKALHDYLDEKEVPHIYHIDAGGHEGRVWKNDLYLLSQQLFRDRPAGPPARRAGRNRRGLGDGIPGGGPGSLPGPGDGPADEAGCQARRCLQRGEPACGETAALPGGRAAGVGA